MIKFEDDDPSKKYVLFLDFNSEEGSTYLSQAQKDLIDTAEVAGNPSVDFKDGRKIRISAIKFIKPAENWRSAEEKLEEAKAKHVSDLHWAFINATRGNSPDKDMTFETFLKERLGKSDETIVKIMKQFSKSETGQFEL